MDATNAARLQSLFAAAVDLPADQRDAFVASVRDGGEAALSAELRRLLEADDTLAHTTARTVSPDVTLMLAATAPGGTLTGLRVGAFELREELGRGGMGRVYRAERVDGKVAQQVAVKFVRRELLDTRTRRRFHLERQLMATLDHPQIARLVDAAELDDGTPYYVMEYVDGVPITAYCEREGLGARERVALVRKACAAVAGAHRALVVHRDLKPSNILIDGTATPKLLDFGIAKPLLGAPLGEETGTGERFFSPHYAAPEQVTGAPVGVACDVYALGLLLYELLTGRRPFEFDNLSPGQIERLITDVPPLAPSAMAARNPAAPVPARQLRGDLDGIVLKCLRKAPHQRYASVEQLEADLGAYLDGLPVRARGGHGWYRLQKYVRRNALPLTAAALLVVALAAGVVALATRARMAEEVAQFEAELLGQIDPTNAGALLSTDVRRQYDAALARMGLSDAERAARSAAFAAEWQRIDATRAARNLIDATVLEPAVAGIGQIADQPVVEATLRQVLAIRYQEVGLYDAALPLQEQALAIRRRVLGEDHPDTLTSMDWMGTMLQDVGRRVEAEQWLRRTLAARRRVLGDAHPDTLVSINGMGKVLFLQRKLDEADAYWREGLERSRAVLGADHPRTLTALDNMAKLRRAQGRLDEAEALARETLERTRRAQGEDHPETIASLGALGGVLVARGKLAEAEPHYRAALETSRRARGDDDPDTIAVLNNMGVFLRAGGRLAEAEPYFREALERSRRVLGEAHATTLLMANNLGALLVSRGRAAEAERYYREVAVATARELGPGHPDAIRADANLGNVLREQGKLAEAEAQLADALDRARRRLGADHYTTLTTLTSVATLHLAQHRPADAIALLAPADAAARRTFSGERRYRLARLLTARGRAHAQIGDYALAEQQLLEAHALLAQTPGPDANDRRECVRALVALYDGWEAAQPGQGYAAQRDAWRKADDA